MTLEEAGKKVLANVQKRLSYIDIVHCILTIKSDGLYLSPKVGYDLDYQPTIFYRDIKTENQTIADYEVKL